MTDIEKLKIKDLHNTENINKLRRDLSLCREELSERECEVARLKHIIETNTNNTNKETK